MWSRRKETKPLDSHRFNACRPFQHEPPRSHQHRKLTTPLSARPRRKTASAWRRQPLAQKGEGWKSNAALLTNRSIPQGSRPVNPDPEAEFKHAMSGLETRGNENETPEARENSLTRKTTRTVKHGSRDGRAAPRSCRAGTSGRKPAESSVRTTRREEMPYPRRQ